MFISKNLLTLEERQYLKVLMDKEIAENAVINSNIPSYQSYATMHKKFSNDTVFSKLNKKILLEAEICYNKGLLIENCWFNICREDSRFVFHRHAFPVSAVYYVKNCENNGTIFEINNGVHLKVMAEDNNVFFFDPAMLHSVPEWDGADRYSIAFDLCIK